MPSTKYLLYKLVLFMKSKWEIYLISFNIGFFLYLKVDYLNVQDIYFGKYFSLSSRIFSGTLYFHIIKTLFWNVGLAVFELFRAPAAQIKCVMMTLMHSFITVWMEGNSFKLPLSEQSRWTRPVCPPGWTPPPPPCPVPC